MENFKLIEEKDNPLFSRKEVLFQISSEVAPSRMEIGKIVSEKFSTEPKKVKIKKISGKFGSKNFSVNVFIYKTEEQKNRTEIKRKKDSLHIVVEKKEVAEAKASNIDKNDNKKNVESTINKKPSGGEAKSKQDKKAEEDKI